MEDAASLGVSVADGSSGEVPSILACYSALCCERVRRVQEPARSRAVVNSYPDGTEQEDRDRGLGPSSNAFAASGWLYHHNAVIRPEGDRVVGAEVVTSRPADPMAGAVQPGGCRAGSDEPV